MKKILTTLFLTLAIIGTAVVCSAAPEPKANSAILASVSGEQILYSKNIDSKIAPAEFTKLMTAYTVYKLYGMDTAVTVADNLSDYTHYSEASMKLKAGEVLTTGNLIYGMLVEQANDSAYALALHYGGIDTFVAKMNEYAKGLEMKNTVFTNPTGKEDANQYTTAGDLLKLYRAIYKEKGLYQAICTKNVTIPATDLSAERQYWTKNHLMSKFIYNNYLYGPVTAGVSSSTDFGGYSVIATAVKGDTEYVGIVLGSVKEENINCAMTDAVALFDYGFNEFKTVDLIKIGTLIKEAEVKNGDGKDTLLLCANRSMKVSVLKDDDVSSVVRNVVVNEPLEAPIKKGDVVGYVEYSYNGNYVGSLELVAEQDVEKSSLKAFLEGVSWFFGLPVVKFFIWAIIIFFVIMIVAAYIRAKRRRSRRRNRRTNYKKF
ncbi:MAG: D-alanyl-D-alanine carboxypeptidase [Clostridia bacterium]|nr:D-alanyl-D-alanine carboxypeptidase [Clostridia bacterium]